MCRRTDLSDLWRIVLTLCVIGIHVAVVSSSETTGTSAKDDHLTRFVQSGVATHQLRLPDILERRASTPRQLSHQQQSQILFDIQQHTSQQQQLADASTANNSNQQHSWSSHTKQGNSVAPRSIDQASFLVPQQTNEATSVFEQQPQASVKTSVETSRHAAESRGSSQDLHLNGDRHQLFRDIENQTQQQQQQQVPIKPKQNQQQVQEQLQKQFQQQLFERKDLLRKLKQTISEAVAPGEDVTEKIPAPIKSSSSYKYYDRQLQSRANNAASTDNNLLHQIRTISDPTTTNKPWTASFEELSKGVLPQGAQFEVIRHNGDNQLEVGKLPANLPDKNVTFVFLEEQTDGTFKVQGIKGGNNTDQQDGGVNSIIKKIQDGDLKLPPSTRLHAGVAEESSPKLSYVTPSTDFKSLNHIPSNVQVTQSVTFPTTTLGSYHNNPWLNTERTPVLITAPSTYKTSSRAPPKSVPSSRSTYLNKPSSTAPTKKNAHFLPTVETLSTLENALVNQKNGYKKAEELQPVSSSTQKDGDLLQRPYRRLPSSESDGYNVTNNLLAGNKASPQTKLTTSDVLKNEGLFAMAKFLKDSGLDNIIHNKGPFTLFAPTDKAFRALFQQLGGPDKAMSKFRENPRLLSGLLLHHVIPGVFRIGSLLDEMTGVSLAGTQLRVNTYTAQDKKWTDLQMVTVNGARVLKDKQDLSLPHGSIAHAIDRVMFPLPVGDLILTLQSDRTRRFGKFLRLLQTARIGDLVTDTSSVTLFAPTDDAFAIMAPEDVERLLNDHEMARALVLRHITPGALFSVGMRHFQERPSMLDGQPISVYKNEGHVKVNSASVVTYNTPATNGVIHAINGLL